MIVLDAAVLIAYLESADVHHQSAVDLLVERAGEDLLISPINRAEVLVGPSRAGRMGDAADAFARIGLRDVPLDEDAPVRLAELRASTALKLPDCCALLAAQQTGATLATFDDRLRRAATGFGVDVAPV